MTTSINGSQLYFHERKKVDPEYNLAKKCPEIAAHAAFVRDNVPEWAPVEQRMIAFIESESYKNMKSSKTRSTQF